MELTPVGPGSHRVPTVGRMGKLLITKLLLCNDWDFSHVVWRLNVGWSGSHLLEPLAVELRAIPTALNLPLQLLKLQVGKLVAADCLNLLVPEFRARIDHRGLRQLALTVSS